ncbi:flagella basal body P-ring formation protein FlgA [Sphingomonas sp.]|uniref:flagella basal body P-ring formation protein FlgA n=1 Tax=Sphingomonas sp. TaxID=28214 RepID=UPI002DD69731|nr:flagella basal body P-ring formation protein FlgA [Sphingomonas sp.]
MIRPLLILAALAPATATAQIRYQDTTAIDVAVQAFTGQPIGAEGGARTAVDARLKLAACPLPQLDWRAATQDAVVVTCEAPRWRIFVPVKMPPLAARPTVVAAAAVAPVVPAARAAPVIKRGDPITVEAGNGGFSITRDGVAMGDAAPGERLMVRIDPAKPPIQAVALDTGRATLPGWDR